MSLRPNGCDQHHTSDFFYPMLMSLQQRWRCSLNSSPLYVGGRDVDQHQSPSTNMAKITPIECRTTKQPQKGLLTSCTCLETGQEGWESTGTGAQPGSSLEGFSCNTVKEPIVTES